MSKSVRITYEKDGKECAIIVKKPAHSQLTEANLYAASIFNRARKTGVCLRSQIDDWLQEQAIWTKEDRIRIKELEENINKKINLLNIGQTEDGEKMKLSEARKLAIDIRIDRLKLNLAAVQRRQYDEYTVEGQTENARFDYLASLCILDEEGKRLFQSIDDYYDLADEKYINEAAAKLANMMFGQEDWEKELPENKFLFKYNLVDKDGRLVDKEGRFIDSDGKLLNQEQAEEVNITEPPVFEDDTN